MREIRFVDSSVLCDIIAVPGKTQQHEEVVAELRELVESGVQLVLPIATIIETGNHIAQAVDGNARRRCAQRFCALLHATADGSMPWVMHAVAWNASMLRMLCDGTEQSGRFVDLAAAGLIGTGDLSILAEVELYRRRTAGVQVALWTHDQKQAAYA